MKYWRRRIRNKLIADILIMVMAITGVCAGFKENANAEYFMSDNALKFVYEFFDTIDSQNYEELLNFYANEEAEEINKIYTNIENENNHVALFNVKSANVISVNKILEDDYRGIIQAEESLYQNYVIYDVQVELEVYSEDDFYTNGINEYYMILKRHNEEYYIESLQVPNIVPEVIDIPDVIPYGLDTPILQTSYSNPSSIKVYISSTGTIKSVGFKSYCYCVAANEIGYSNWPSESLKACALAIKVFALHNYYYYKDASRGYHISDSSSNGQSYNPDKANIIECSNAVNSIWNYIIVDKNGALIRSFYRAGANDGLGFHEGKLYQNGCVYLYNAFHMSYSEMIEYYYSRTSNIIYYNTEVPVGAVRVASQS